MTTLVSGGAVPVGSIIPFGGNSGNVPDGFLLCNGALLNRNDFADLFAAIGTHWGTSSGTDFRIPTTQGLLLRGTAYGSGHDPDRNSRNAIQTGGQSGDQVGSYQTNRYQSHAHYQYRAWSVNNLVRVNGLTNYGTGNGAFNFGTNRLWLGMNNNFSPRGFNGNANDNNVRGVRTTSSSSGGNQTVGRNVYVNYIIKY